MEPREGVVCGFDLVVALSGVRIRPLPECPPRLPAPSRAACGQLLTLCSQQCPATPAGRPTTSLPSDAISERQEGEAARALHPAGLPKVEV